MANKRTLDLAKIVDQASRMIAEVGLSRTTMPSLAKRLHVRSQSLYHYVANRKELLSLVGAARIRLLHHQLVEKLMGVSGSGALLTFADTTRSFILGDRALTQILFHLNEYNKEDDIVQGVMSIIRLGEKLNLKTGSVVSLHALLGAVLGYVFFDGSASFASESKGEANRNYHEMVLRLVDPTASLENS